MTAKTKNGGNGFRRDARDTRRAVSTLPADGCWLTVFSVSANGAFAGSYAYDTLSRRVSTTSLSTTNHASTPNSSFLTPNFFRFHGGAYSAATGLYQFRARWYSPELGRWLSPDPIGLEGGLNLYEAFANNPVNFTDPYGEDVADYNWNWLYNVSDFSAGFGDTISMGLTSWFRDQVYDDDLVDECSGWYKGGELAGVIYDTASGLKGGAKWAGKKTLGKEFSHWIPDRVLKQTNNKWMQNKFGRSIWNGNYVDPARHYAHDPFRYPVGWQNMGNKYTPVIQQLDRIPRVYVGGAAGAAAGTAGMYSN